MKAKDTPQIIEKAFVSIDTSKLAKLKSGSFWKEQFCAALNLIPCVGGALAQEKYTKLINIYRILNDNAFKSQEQKQYDLELKQKLEQIQITWGTMK